MNGQASIEFVAIIGVALVLALPFVVEGQESMVDLATGSEDAKFQSEMNELGDTVTQVTASGDRTKRTIKFQIPQNIESVTTQKRALIFTQDRGNKKNFSASFDSEISTSNIPVDQGIYVLEVERLDGITYIRRNGTLPENFILNSINYQDPVEIGNQQTVQYTVRNTGDEQGSQYINFSVENSTVQYENQEGPEMLEAGDTTSSQFTWTTDSIGTYKLVIETQNDTEARQFEVVDPSQPYFKVDIDESATDATVEQGNTFSSEYIVNNTGDKTDTQDISYEITQSGTTVASDPSHSQMTLSPSDSPQQASINWDTTELSTGIYNLTVSSENSTDRVEFEITSPALSEPLVGGEWSRVVPADVQGGYDYFFNSSESPYGDTYGGNNSVQYDNHGFYVMKYQASENSSNSGVPQSVSNKAGWNDIPFNDKGGSPNAYESCQALDNETDDYDVHLITNREWMTVARQVAQRPENWADNTVGSTGSSGGLYQGNTDLTLDRAVRLGWPPHAASVGGSDQRTHILASGDAVWDLSGDLREWVDADEDGTTMSFYSDNERYEVNATNSTVNGGDGLGTGSGLKILFYDLKAGVRGGSWYEADDAGIFFAVSNDPEFSSTLTGFRCSAVPVS